MNVIDIKVWKICLQTNSELRLLLSVINMSASRAGLWNNNLQVESDDFSVLWCSQDLKDATKSFQKHQFSSPQMMLEIKYLGMGIKWSSWSDMRWNGETTWWSNEGSSSLDEWWGNFTDGSGTITDVLLPSSLNPRLLFRTSAADHLKGNQSCGSSFHSNEDVNLFKHARQTVLLNAKSRANG